MWGWREDNPAKYYDRSVVRERRSPILLPEDPHIDMVIDASPANFGRCLRLLRQTGMREMEGALLERPQIDHEGRRITLIRTKTNRPRVLELTDDVAVTLAVTPAHITSRFVFWHGDGGPYLGFATRFAAITKRVAKAAEREGVEFRRFRCHDLRHKYAVEYLRGGGSIYDLQQILGHSSIKTTEIYLDYLTPTEKEIVKRPSQNPSQV